MTKNIVKNEGVLDATTRKIINDNLEDVGYCTATLSATSGDTGTTLTNIAGMVTGTLQPGTYKFRIHLAGVATANSGMKVGLKQSVASMLTSIESIAVGTTATGVVCQHSTTATDAASLMASTTAFLKLTIEGTVVVALAGTLQVQGAQNASHADTTSFYLGSFMEFTKIA